MKHAIKTTFFFLLLCTYSYNSFAGGGWIQAKKGGFFKLSQTFLFGNKYFDLNGNIVDISTTGVYITGVYAEFGVSNKFTAIMNGTLITMRVNGSSYPDGTEITKSAQTTSIGDTDIALKYGLYQSSKIAVAATVLFGIPTGNPSAGDGGVLQTGDGEFNTLIQLDVGKPLGKGYVNASFSFNNRTNGFSDEIRWGVEGGIGVKKFYFILRTSAIHSLYNSEETEGSIEGIFSNNVEYIAYSIEANYLINDNWGVGGNVSSVFTAKRILNVPSWNFGVFYKI